MSTGWSPRRCTRATRLCSSLVTASAPDAPHHVMSTGWSPRCCARARRRTWRAASTTGGTRCTTPSRYTRENVAHTDLMSYTHSDVTALAALHHAVEGAAELAAKRATLGGGDAPEPPHARVRSATVTSSSSCVRGPLLICVTLSSLSRQGAAGPSRTRRGARASRSPRRS